MLFPENVAVVLDILMLQDKYKYILCKNKIYAAKQITEKLAFLPVSEACTNKFYIFQQCTYIAYISL